MRHWKNASAMLCCFHRRMNRSARCTLPSHLTCFSSASRAALRFASMSSAQCENTIPHVFHIILCAARFAKFESARRLAFSPM